MSVVSTPVTGRSVTAGAVVALALLGGSAVAHADDNRTEQNTVRPHEAIAWNRPLGVHLGRTDP